MRRPAAGSSAALPVGAQLLSGIALHRPNDDEIATASALLAAAY